MRKEKSRSPTSAFFDFRPDLFIINLFPQNVFESINNDGSATTADELGHMTFPRKLTSDVTEIGKSKWRARFEFKIPKKTINSL